MSHSTTSSTVQLYTEGQKEWKKMFNSVWSANLKCKWSESPQRALRKSYTFSFSFLGQSSKSADLNLTDHVFHLLTSLKAKVPETSKEFKIALTQACRASPDETLWAVHYYQNRYITFSSLQFNLISLVLIHKRFFMRLWHWWHTI